MPSYPAVSGKEVVRALEKLGFELDRISDSSHYIMKKPGHPTTVPVPVHGNETVREGTFHSILRLAGLTRKQFFEAYWKR